MLTELIESGKVTPAIDKSPRLRTGDVDCAEPFELAFAGAGWDTAYVTG